MTHTLDAFAARVREILLKEGNPAGRAGPTRLIRIEGTNMERVARRKYEPRPRVTRRLKRIAQD